jgi:hypothetical protein
MSMIKRLPQVLRNAVSRVRRALPLRKRNR